MYQAAWAALSLLSAKLCLPVPPALSISPVLSARRVYVLLALHFSLLLPTKWHPRLQCWDCSYAQLSRQGPLYPLYPQQLHELETDFVLESPTRSFQQAKFRLK